MSPARWRCRQFFYYEPGHARSRERTRTRVLRRADTVKKRPEREENRWLCGSIALDFTGRGMSSLAESSPPLIGPGHVAAEVIATVF